MENEKIKQELNTCYKDGTNLLDHVEDEIKSTLMRSSDGEIIK